MQIYNKFDKEAEGVENNLKKARQVEAARAIYADKPFSERYATAATAAKVLGFICNGASFITGSTAISYSLYISLNNMNETVAIGAGGAIGVAAAALLEIVKTSLIIGLFTSIYKYKKASIGITLAAFALQTLSISISFYGGRMLPKIATEEQAFDASKYDKQAEAITAEIEKIRKMNKWHGTVTSVGNEFIKAEKEKEEKVEAARAAALAEHQAKTAKAATEQSETINIVGYIAIGNEALILFCFAFYAYFLYRVFRENEESESEESENPTVATTAPPPATAAPSTGQPAPPSNNSRPIGFFIKDGKPDEIVMVKPEHKNPHLRNCANCNTEFQYNHNKQKYCTDECRYAAAKARKTAE